MKIRFLFYIIGSVMLFTACNHPKSYVLEGNITGLVNPALYVVTSLGHDSKSDTIFSKEGKFNFTASADSIQPVILFMEDGDVWITVWAEDGDSIQIEGDAYYPELIKSNGNEINDLLTGFRQGNKEIIKEKTDIADDSIKTDLNQTLIKNTQTFIKKHPESIASLVLIQDYLMESEDPVMIGEALALIENPAKENKLYIRLNAIYQHLQQEEN
jgi:hypothetical protein